MTETENTESHKAYLKLFEGKERDALEVALEVRKLEFDLYWRRVAYGWGLSAVAFVGFFAIDPVESPFNQLVVGCVGFVFSLAWYCTNRGGSAGLRNWEIHVELLEGEKIGPLFKTVMGRDTYKWWQLWLPYPFSPQRINNILSLFLVVAWLLLIIQSVLNVYQAKPIFAHLVGSRTASVVAIMLITFIAAGAILVAIVKHPNKYKVRAHHYVRKVE